MHLLKSTKVRMSCLLAGGLALFIGSLPTLAERPQPRTSVVLITVDTLRADHLSCYGYHLITSPRLDRLAEQGVRFERARTTIPLTGPAHTSLFTSRYPQETGARVNGQPVARDPRLLTLARILERNGYRTAAYVSAWPLKKRLTRLHRGFQVYDQEFGRNYQWLNSYRSAEDVTPKAMEWLRSHYEQPFFLWVHYFDPHGPYVLWEEFADLKPNPAGHSRTRPEDEEMEERIRNYDSEIAYTDHHIGKLLDEMQKLGIRDSTLTVVLADHGESLGERDYVGHGRQLYDNIVRIPMIFHHPGALPTGRVVRQNVTLLDVTPTILDLVGVEPPLPFQGKSLLPYMDDLPLPEDRSTYFMTFPGKPGQAPKWISWLWHLPSGKKLPLKMGQLRGDRKLIWTPTSNEVEVFNLAQDRNEENPIFAGESPSPIRARVDHLKSWYRSTNRHAKNRPTLKKRDIEVLRTLGYID